MGEAEGNPRKINITDFLDPIVDCSRTGKDGKGGRGEKVDTFRKQREFGARKRIKPDAQEQRVSSNRQTKGTRKANDRLTMGRILYIPIFETG